MTEKKYKDLSLLLARFAAHAAPKGTANIFGTENLAGEIMQLCENIDSSKYGRLEQIISDCINLSENALKKSINENANKYDINYHRKIKSMAFHLNNMKNISWEISDILSPLNTIPKNCLLEYFPE